MNGGESGMPDVEMPASAEDGLKGQGVGFYRKVRVTAVHAEAAVR